MVELIITPRCADWWWDGLVVDKMGRKVKITGCVGERTDLISFVGGIGCRGALEVEMETSLLTTK